MHTKTNNNGTKNLPYNMWEAISDHLTVRNKARLGAVSRSARRAVCNNVAKAGAVVKARQATQGLQVRLRYAILETMRAVIKAAGAHRMPNKNLGSQWSTTSRSSRSYYRTIPITTDIEAKATVYKYPPFVNQSAFNRTYFGHLEVGKQYEAPLARIHLTFDVYPRKAGGSMQIDMIGNHKKSVVHATHKALHSPLLIASLGNTHPRVQLIVDGVVANGNLSTH